MKEVIHEENIVEWLLEEIPKLRPYYNMEDSERDEKWNSYALFSFVLNPYIKLLLENEAFGKIENIFESLEFLANYGDESVKNELQVAMEELGHELHQLWPFLGSTMKSNVKYSITWYPEAWPDIGNVNQHIDRKKYLERWDEEVKKIGGWQKLTIPHLLKIRYELVKEFDIQYIITYKPGNKEWKEANLPWPL